MGARIFSSDSQMKNSILFLFFFSSCVFCETLQVSMQKTQETFRRFLEHPFLLFFCFCFCLLALWGLSHLLSFLFSRLFSQNIFTPVIWKGWDVLFFALFYFLSFVIIGNLCKYFLPSFAKNQEYFFRLFIYWTANAFCLFSLLFFLSFVPGYDKKTLGIQSLGSKKFLGAILGYIAFLPWYLFLFYFAHLLFAVFSLEPQAQEVAQEILKSEGYTYWFAVTTVILIAPLIEEFLFRAFFYGAIRDYFGVFFSILITSVVFSIMHHNLFAFLPILGLGIFLQILYEKSQCLWACVLAHSLHNTLTLLYLLK